MIVSRLPPSRFTGDIATSIHTHAFHCFVSTARHFVVSRRWETMIFDGDPGVDKLIPCARLFYPAGFKRDDIYDIHEIIDPRPKPPRQGWADSLKQHFGVDPLIDEFGNPMQWVGRRQPVPVSALPRAGK